MRPGQDGPGNSTDSGAPTRAGDPSMRPGQDGPGNGHATAHCHIDVTPFNEAGARWPRKPRVDLGVRALFVVRLQ